MEADVKRGHNVSGVTVLENRPEARARRAVSLQEQKCKVVGVRGKTQSARWLSEEPLQMQTVLFSVFFLAFPFFFFLSDIS